MTAKIASSRPGEAIFQGYDSVSYTHLDVYKRQDLDIVNPFFRSAELKPLLLENGVELVYPAYALSGVDIPILPAEVELSLIHI